MVMSWADKLPDRSRSASRPDLTAAGITSTPRNKIPADIDIGGAPQCSAGEEERGTCVRPR